MSLFNWLMNTGDYSKLEKAQCGKHEVSGDDIKIAQITSSISKLLIGLKSGHLLKISTFPSEYLTATTNKIIGNNFMFNWEWTATKHVRISHVKLF